MSTNPAGCDYERAASQYVGEDGEITCRCMVCSRCKHHTGNSTQGHYWGYCQVTKTIRDFHFCCPDNCELESTP